MNVAQQIVKTLEARGLEFAFGVPGEENISLVTELEKSKKMTYLTCSDEQSATFMAWMVGWLTGRPGLSIATLGPGALNMSMAVADAMTHSFPLLAFSAQGPLESLNKETKQVVDLKEVYTPLTKFADYLYKPSSTSELINKAYNEATDHRQGSVYIGVPSDFEREEAGEEVLVTPNENHYSVPSSSSIHEAAELIKGAMKPLIVAGLGASRENVSSELKKFVDKHNLPIATTYMAKGIVSEEHSNSLGVLGFLIDDYIDKELSQYDLILTVGFDFSELGPDRLNPNMEKSIIHIHNYEQDTHSHYPVSVNLIGQMNETLIQLSNELADYTGPEINSNIRTQLNDELSIGGNSTEDSVLSLAQIIHATKEVIKEDDRILVDTGALKMWMARLFPAKKLNQVMVNNAMSSMAWSIPGTIAAKLVEPNRRLVTMTGDGSFNMNSQELALAKKLNLPMTIVIWADDGYELIKWKMEMTINESAGTSFENPDFTKIAEAYGGNGHVAKSRDHYEEVLRNSLEKQTGIDIIVVPMDYNLNYELTERLK